MNNVLSASGFFRPPRIRRRMSAFCIYLHFPAGEKNRWCVHDGFFVLAAWRTRLCNSTGPLEMSAFVWTPAPLCYVADGAFLKFMSKICLGFRKAPRHSSLKYKQGICGHLCTTHHLILATPLTCITITRGVEETEASCHQSCTVEQCRILGVMGDL